jgi:putative transposase
MPPLYETSLSDAAWEVICPIFSPEYKTGRPRTHSIRHIIDGILYVVKNGCVWRCLPSHNVPAMQGAWRSRAASKAANFVSVNRLKPGN